MLIESNYVDLAFCYHKFVFKPITIPKSRLFKYFEISELPEELGGTLAYNHEQWLCNRIVSIICFMFIFNICMNITYLYECILHTGSMYI